MADYQPVDTTSPGGATAAGNLMSAAAAETEEELEEATRLLTGDLAGEGVGVGALSAAAAVLGGAHTT